MKLAAVTFSPDSNFPQGQDVTDFAVGNGSISTTGGMAETLGKPGLYVGDSFSWDVVAGTPGSITFTGLQVVQVDAYWVHPSDQNAGATMTANFSDGTSMTVASNAVTASGPLGQAGGFIAPVIAPTGETITGLTLELDSTAADGDVASLDVLELTVQQ